MPQFAFPRLTRAVKNLLIANAVCFFLFFALWYGSAPGEGGSFVKVLHALGLYPPAWKSEFPLVPVWQFVTYGFLHSVTDIGHLIGNMLMLYFFGGMLEERIGSRRFLITYFAAQFAGALLFLAPLLFGLSSGPAIGASGAVYGVMIAVATLYPRQTVYLIIFPLQLRWLALGVLGVTVFGALVDMKQGGGSTAHLVHLGGIVYGFLAVRLGLIEKDPIEIFERKRAVLEVTRAADDEVRMDHLLDKIHREGMNSLTRSEKEFLKRMSSRR